jgi:hypothetical protein
MEIIDPLILSLVAGLAFLIDGFKGYPSVETIVDHFGEFLRG